MSDNGGHPADATGPGSAAASPPQKRHGSHESGAETSQQSLLTQAPAPSTADAVDAVDAGQPDRGPDTGQQIQQDQNKVWKARHALVCFVLAAMAFIQDPGRIAADTKLDLNINPAGFLERALHLWDPLGFAGQLQNQGYGYLWPMGPFFWLGHAIGMPAWVVQRLWWALLLCVAYIGIVKLAGALGIGSPFTRMLGGLAYVFAPRIVSTMGIISIESWPTALAPWVLIPLVLATKSGAQRKRLLALSALAFACIGGVNAVATSVVAIIGLWWLLTRRPVAAMMRTTAWWLLFLLLASMWWLIPLVLLGKYSPPFLDWIESAEVTTSVTSPINAWRGVVAWVPFLGSESAPASAAGWQLVSNQIMIAATSLVAVVGAIGLGLKRTPHRIFLVPLALLGFLLMCAGFATTAAGGPFAEQVQMLLDGALAPLRNVHKFDVLLRLPLILGFVIAMEAIRKYQPLKMERRKRQQVFAGASLALIAVISAPVWTGTLTQGRSFTEIPEYWQEANDYLASEQASRVLVVPGASFGQYLWGRTNDEPLQAFGEIPWNVRDAVPLGSAGNTRLLDSINRQLESGTGNDGLAEVLSRAGISHIVVRNDIDREATTSPGKSVIHAALNSSPGISLATFFGPLLNTPVSEALIVDSGIDGAYPAVEIYKVDAAPAVSPVYVRNADTWVRLVGGAESLLSLLDLLPTQAPIVTASSPGVAALTAAGNSDASAPSAAPITIATDSMRARELAFGSMRNNFSQTKMPGEENRQNRPVVDYLPDPEPDLSTVLFSDGIRITASSSASDATATIDRSLARQPYAAVDGNPLTDWRPGRWRATDETWWRIDFGNPVTMPESVDIRLANLGIGVARPTALRVTTDRGEAVTTIDDASQTVDLKVPSGPTSFMQIDLEATGPGQQRGFGIAELSLPEGTVERAIKLPEIPADGWMFTAAGTLREQCVRNGEKLTCSPALAIAGEEESDMLRWIRVGESGRYEMLGTASVRQTDASARFLSVPGGVSITASSQQSTLATRGPAAMDGTDETAWIASPNDENPSLEIVLPEPRNISGLRLQNRIDLNASAALEVEVALPGQFPVSYFPDANGVISFPEVTTQELKLTFKSVTPKTEARTGARLPVGVSSLTLLGAEDLQSQLNPALSMQIPCGFSAPLSSNGELKASTQAAGPIEDALTGRPITVTECDELGFDLTAGDNFVDFGATAELNPRSLLMLQAADGERLAAAPTAAALAVETPSPTLLTATVPPAAQVRLVELTQNFNAGWQAELTDPVTGEVLTLSSIEVDGWRQAFVLPANAAGDLKIHFAPDVSYRLGLMIGLFSLVTLLLVGVRSRKLSSIELHPWRNGHWFLVVLGALTAVVVGGLAGVIGLCLGAYCRYRRLSAALVISVAGLIGFGISVGYPWPASSTQPELVSQLQTLTVAVVMGVWVWVGIDALRRWLVVQSQPNSPTPE